MLQKSFFTKVILLFFISFIARNTSAQQFSLVKDLNPTAAASGIEATTQSAVMNNVLYFTAKEDATGSELWRSDGTAVGTYLVKDIETSSKGSDIKSMTVLGNTLFFIATTSESGAELWTSDGSETGTTLLTELGKTTEGAGIFVSSVAKNKNMVAYNGKVYFNTAKGVMQSDGTEKGTEMFFETTIAMQMEEVNGALYLSNGSRLYSTEGGPPSLLIQEGMSGYTVLGGEMLIKATPLGLMFTGKNTLWVTTGALAETRKIYTALGATPRFDFNRSIATATKFYFLHDNKDVAKAIGLQVWVTDGTTAGTKVIKVIGNNSGNTNYCNFNAFNENVYFWFSNGAPANLELWKTDGTDANTLSLTTFADTNTAVANSEIGIMTIESGKIKFMGQYADGVYVSRTDGTVAGTLKEFKFAPVNALGGRVGMGFKKVGTTTLFAGNVDAQIGTELYRLGTAPYSMSLSVITKIKCNGEKTGSIESVVEGGIGSNTYKWSSGQTTAKLTGLGAGKYTVTVTNGAGLTLTSFYTFTEPSKLNANVNTSSTPAGQKLGRASALGMGGTPAYTYLWNTVPGQSVTSLKNLAAGTYTVTITDANQCKLVREAIVGVLAINFTEVKPIKCNGAKDGELEVNVPEWTAGVNTYLWSNGNKTAKATGLGAGAYTVTITSATNQAVTAKYDVVEPTKLTLTSVVKDEVSGGANGSIKLTAAGGTGAITYKWSSPITSTSNEATALTKGSYTVTATDGNGCNTIETYTLLNSALALTQTNEIKCFGDKTGALDATTPGAASYVWNTGATTPIISGLGAGVYTPTVTLASGQVLTSSKEIKEPSALIATTTTSDATGNQSNGKATAAAAGGTPPYTYAWSSGQTTAEISNLAAGTYKVNVTDKNGCMTTGSAIVKSTINTNEVAAAMGLTVYPNPTSSAITLSIKNVLSENYAYQIIDILGRVQQSGIWSSQNTLISVDALPSGTYLLTLKSEKSSIATVSFNVVK